MAYVPFRRRVSRRLLLGPFVLCCISTTIAAFVTQPSGPVGSRPGWQGSPRKLNTRTTELYMVFDFFQKRSQEGLEQLSRLSDAAAKGKLGLGLTELAVYTQQTNKAFAAGLSKSRNQLLNNMDALFSGQSGDLLEELQDILLVADLGMSTAEDIVAEVKSLQQDASKRLKRDDLISIMRGKLIEALTQEGMEAAVRFSATEDMPTVLFVMGANGMGKTTTIGKLAHRLRTEGNQKVLIAACDTFRAGAVEQLQQWAERAEVDCFGPSEQRNSPSAVLYGALDKALAEKYDTVLVDTSGRLSNNDALTAELVKMKKVIQKRLSVERDADNKPIFNKDVPHETLLVLDAAQGRMALDSAKVWDKKVGLTGLILTKLDGSARGGSVVAVSRELQLPVKLIGVGEGIDDLRDFEAERFVDGLLGIGNAGGGSSANEGALVASRLDEMRKERDFRAVESKVKKSMPSPIPAMGGDAGELTFQEMESPPPEEVFATAGGNSRPRRSKNKKKKKKKGRR